MAISQPRGSQIRAATITDTEIAAAAAIASTKLAAWSGDRSAGGFKLTTLGTPSASGDAATKGYVDGVAQGLDVKPSCRAATTVNITLSGTQTIDDVALSVNDRVLVKNQNTGANNCIYVVAAGAWTRALDADTSAEVTSGLFTFITEGTLNGGHGFVLTTDDPITLGTTALVFAQFSGAGSIIAGEGLTQIGNQININPSDDSILVGPDSIIVQRDVSGAIGFGAVGIAVNVDSATIEINANALRVKAGGIGETHLGAGIYQRSARIIIREVPTGAINGSNVTFGIANSPIAGSEQVFLNGILQQSGAGNDYTISGATITYLTAPVSGDRILVNYRY